MLPLYSKLHSCKLCSKVILDASALDFNKEAVELPDQAAFDLGFSLQDAVEAAKDGCSFFASVIPSPDGATDYSEWFNTAHSTRIKLSYWKSTNMMKQTQQSLSTSLVKHNGDDIWANRQFKLYTHPTLSSPAFLTTTMPNLDVASPSSLRTALAWLTDCVLNHRGHCDVPFPRTALERPKRLIRVSSNSGTEKPTVQLVETPQNATYIALSYCWGQDQLKTTKATLPEFEKGISLMALSKTVQDAIITVQGLNFRFLWVDCLCIVQDDADELAIEIDKMADIYQGSSITILASSASSSTEGFLAPRLDVPAFQISFLTSSRELKHLVLEVPPLNPIQAEPTNKRAWCMQEAVVSRRLLSYSSHQLSWHCALANMSDGGYAPPEPTGLWVSKRVLREKTPNMGNLSKDTLYGWNLLVEQYSSRDLSVPSDKLPGLSGVAKKFANIFQDSYTAGLWKLSLHMSLCWEFYLFAYPKKERQPRPATYRAPSWSWASIDGRVQMESMDSSSALPYQRLVEILSVSTVPVSPLAQYGQVKSASLRVRGPMRQARWGAWDARDEYGRFFLTGLDGESDFIDSVLANPDTSESIPEGEVVWLLLVRPFREDKGMKGLEGLVLKELKDCMDAKALLHIKAFRRIASCYVPAEFCETAKPWLKSFQTLEVVIM